MSAITKQYCVLGRHGFLGKALAERLQAVTSFPTDETKIIFDFASYTHPDFEQNPDWHIGQQLNRFQEILSYAARRGITVVYPSSALVYEKDTTFSKFKKTLENLAGCFKCHTIGLRIFPVYGPGESRTVISKWCHGMALGERPVVYGDGNQARDFIYINDVIDQILSVVETCKYQSNVIDIGTGRLTRFNDIIKMINEELGASIEPRYVNRPSSYSEGIVCHNPGHYSFEVRNGIKRILGQRVLEPALQ